MYRLVSKSLKFWRLEIFWTVFAFMKKSRLLFQPCTWAGKIAFLTPRSHYEFFDHETRKEGISDDPFQVSLNKQNAIWTSRTNAIYQFKKHLGKLPAGLEEQAASSDETTGLLPDTVKVYLLSKLLYPPPNPSVRLLGSQGLKSLSVQTPNVRRLRQKRCNSVLVCVVLT